MVVDAELHSDEEALLIEHGSHQKDLWGINLYPDLACLGHSVPSLFHVLFHKLDIVIYYHI
jgi:hypothetical protein